LSNPRERGLAVELQEPPPHAVVALALRSVDDDERELRLGSVMNGISEVPA